MNSMMWQTPLGWVRVEAGEGGIERVEFHSCQERLGERAGKATDECPPAAMSLLREARRQIDAYLAGTATTFELPLGLNGLSPFARRVLQALQTVPHGETVTYQDLARLAGSPGAARAVGGVMAANPLPIILPCHRVVTASGGLGGYSGGEGAASKRWLLEHEGALAASG